MLRLFPQREHMLLFKSWERNDCMLMESEETMTSVVAGDVDARAESRERPGAWS